jgi:fibronectin-binding autotransporter adhesin
MDRNAGFRGGAGPSRVLLLRTLIVGLVAMFLLISAARASATTYTWTGAADNGVWTNENNWSPDTGFPASSTDVAEIDSTDQNITYSGTGGALGTIETGGGDGGFYTGTLTVNGDAEVDNIDLQSGTLSVPANQTLEVGDVGVPGSLLAPNGAIDADPTSTVSFPSGGVLDTSSQELGTLSTGADLSLGSNQIVNALQVSDLGSISGGSNSSLSVLGNSTISGSLANMTTLRFVGAVTLGNDVNLGASSTVEFDSTVDGTDSGADSLTIGTSPDADVLFDGSVGGIGELAALTVTGDAEISAPFIGATGEVMFNNASTFNATSEGGTTIDCSQAQFTGHVGPNDSTAVSINGDAEFDAGLGSLGDGLFVSGDLVNDGGTFDAPPAGQNFIVGGDVEMAAGSLQDTGAALSLDGSEDQSLSTGGAALSGLQIADSGTVTTAGPLNITGALTLTAGTLDLNGQTASAGSLTGPGTLTDSGTAAALTVSPAATDNFAGTLSGAAGLTVAGSGSVVVLTGTTTNSGPTTVNAGTLQSNGALSASPVTVASGATFEGTGTATSLTADTGAAVIPGLTSGSTVGILRVAGPITLSSGSDLGLAINGTKPGTGYSQLSDTGATGTVKLGGATLKLTFGYTPAPGDTLTIVQTSGAAISGTFAGLADGAVFTADGAQWRITYAAETVTLTDTPDYKLTVATKGSGKVTGGGISCPTTCSASLPAGTTVALTATPNSGSTFTGWSGGGCSGTGSCAVTVSKALSVTATFAKSASKVGKPSVGHATASGTTARVPLGCSGAGTCKITFTLTVVETVRNGKVTGVAAAAKVTKRTVVVGSGSVKLSAGQLRTLRLTLNATGRRLLDSHSPLHVRLTATASGKKISSSTITFKAPRK